MQANNMAMAKLGGKPKKGGLFMYGVLGWISVGWVGFNLTCTVPTVYPDIVWGSMVAAAANNTVFALFIASFLKCAYTDPGRVPPCYGFYVGDDAKRRRYCRICHVWKPDRAHHCSACNRCVLLMDHHCPWVNNCIGFYNRKFFIQLQLYGCIWFLMTAVQCAYEGVTTGMTVFPPWSSGFNYRGAKEWMQIISYVLLLFTLLSALTMFLVLIPFLKLHLHLISKNSTTIEQISSTTFPYDLGLRRNIEQVLGSNGCLWGMPCHTYASRPSGDGVRWRQDYSRMEEG